MCRGQALSKGAPTGHVHSQSRQLCGGCGLGEGRGRIAVGACVEVTTPLSKRCLFSRKTGETCALATRGPRGPTAAHLGLLLELGHVQEHLCDLPVEHAHPVPVQEEGAVLIDVHLQEGARESERDSAQVSHRPQGVQAGGAGPCLGQAGRAHGRTCSGLQPSVWVEAQPLPEHRLL